MSWSARAESKLHGRAASASLNRVEAEYENIRTALEWSLASGAAGEAMQAAIQLWGVWVPRSMLFEGSQWNSRILALYREDDAIKLRGLEQAVTLARMIGNAAQRPVYLQQARALAETLGDREGIAHDLVETALFERDRGNDERALELLKQAIQMDVDLHEWWQIEAHYWMAHIQIGRGELVKSRRNWEEGLAEERAGRITPFTLAGVSAVYPYRHAMKVTRNKQQHSAARVWRSSGNIRTRRELLFR